MSVYTLRTYYHMYHNFEAESDDAAWKYAVEWLKARNTGITNEHIERYGDIDKMFGPNYIPPIKPDSIRDLAKVTIPSIVEMIPMPDWML